jgi:hypothetical protein
MNLVLPSIGTSNDQLICLAGTQNPVPYRLDLGGDFFNSADAM